MEAKTISADGDASSPNGSASAVLTPTELIEDVNNNNSDKVSSEAFVNINCVNCVPLIKRTNSVI